MGLKNFGFIANEFVASVREKFLAEYEGEKEMYDPEDIEKIVTEDWFVKRFLILAYKKEEEAVRLMKEAMKWRKENVRHVADNYFPREFYETGALFVYEKDKEGIPSLYMRLKYLKKFPELVEEYKKFLIHFIFKIDEEANGNGWLLVMDFTDCGYGHYENMDLTHYMITCMHYYFPAGLDYVVIVDLPWFLRTCWYIAQYWIPEKRRDMVRLVSKETLLDTFDEENLPDFLGGTCSRSYRTAPENCPSALDFGIYTIGIEKERCEQIMEEFKPYLV